MTAGSTETRKKTQALNYRTGEMLGDVVHRLRMSTSLLSPAFRVHGIIPSALVHSASIEGGGGGTAADSEGSHTLREQHLSSPSTVGGAHLPQQLSALPYIQSPSTQRFSARTSLFSWPTRMSTIASRRSDLGGSEEKVALVGLICERINSRPRALLSAVGPGSMTKALVHDSDSSGQNRTL